MKHQIDRTNNKNSIINGLLALLTISFIALGCVCDDLEDENYDEPTDKVQEQTNAEIIDADEASAYEIPSYKVSRAMVETAFLDIDQSIKKDDFSILYDTISDLWQIQITQKDLKKVFAELSESKVDFSKVIGKKFVFSPSPKIEEDLGVNILLLKGYYDLPEDFYTFRFKYVIQRGRWKLIGIKVNHSEIN